MHAQIQWIWEGARDFRNSPVMMGLLVQRPYTARYWRDFLQSWAPYSGPELLASTELGTIFNGREVDSFDI
jgi:hypothetical protein